jgi:hypothetical protein
MTANSAGTNGFTCLPKHGGTRDNKFLVTHRMIIKRCLTSANVRRSAPNRYAIELLISSVSVINPLVLFTIFMEERGAILLFCRGHHTRLNYKLNIVIIYLMLKIIVHCLSFLGTVYLQVPPMFTDGSE